MISVALLYNKELDDRDTEAAEVALSCAYLQYKLT